MEYSDEEREPQSTLTPGNSIQLPTFRRALPERRCSIPILLVIACVMLIIPIIKLIIGIIHYGNCSIRSSIPNYIIASAVVEIIVCFLTLTV